MTICLNHAISYWDLGNYEPHPFNFVGDGLYELWFTTSHCPIAKTTWLVVVCLRPLTLVQYCRLTSLCIGFPQDQLQSCSWSECWGPSQSLPPDVQCRWMSLPVPKNVIVKYSRVTKTKRRKITLPDLYLKMHLWTVILR